MTYAKLIGMMGATASGLDADVQAFLTATGISDGTITTALVNLVASLKSAGIWTKMYAIYPMVGGTATTHKYNLKDPQDTDGAFRITWTGGGLTHNSSGVTGGGSGNYGDTHLNPSTVIPSNEGSCGAFITPLSPSGLGSNYSDIGARGAGSALFILNTHWSDDNTYWSCNGATAFASYSGNFPYSFGFAQMNRQNSGNAYMQISTTRLTGTSAYSTVNLNVYVLAENNGSGSAFNSTRTFKYIYIGKTLTTTEMDNYNTAVVAFQSDLGR